MTKNFSPFSPELYSHRYKFVADDFTVFDTLRNRNLAPKCRRGEPPYYLLKLPDGNSTHVLVSAIFGGDAEDLVTPNYDFDPFNFSDRYNFNFKMGSVSAIPVGDNPPVDIKLRRNSRGWEHFLLKDNTGQAQTVTPVEIKQVDFPEWLPPFPLAHVSVPAFPDYAFTAKGEVWRVRSSNEPLLRAERHPTFLHKSGVDAVKLVSKSGQTHILLVPDMAQAITSHMKSR